MNSKISFIAQVKKVEAKPETNGLDISAKVLLETPQLEILSALASLSTKSVIVTIEPE